MKSKLTWFCGGLSVAALFAVGLLFAGCASPESQPGQNGKSSWWQNTYEANKGGAQLWTENCARCHNSPSPSTYSDAQWQVVMHHMRVRANLTAEEHKQILEFLQSSN